MQKQILINTDTSCSVIGFHGTRCSASCFVSVYSGFCILCSVLRCVGITAFASAIGYFTFLFFQLQACFVAPMYTFSVFVYPTLPLRGEFHVVPPTLYPFRFLLHFLNLSQLLKPSLHLPQLTTTPSTFLSLITLPLH